MTAILDIPRVHYPASEPPLTVVNMFAGPGCGKSTLAAGLFFLAKMALLPTELVTEYAKDLTWDERHSALQDQLYVFTKQHARLRRLRGKVKVAITDSPIILSFVYGVGTAYDTPQFSRLMIERFNSFDNLNFFLDRRKPYVQAGRSQDEAGARKKDGEVQAMLERLKIDYTVVPGDIEGLADIFFRVAEKHPMDTGVFRVLQDGLTRILDR